MKEPFEIEWRGGSVEKHFRKLRPMKDVPWGTLDPSCYPQELLDRARVSWTSIARSEYRAAAAMCDVLGAMLAAKAPLDLVGMAGDFVADEVFHVELASRLAMEIGGGAPVDVDFARMGVASESAAPFARANDLVLTVGCISETLSGAIAVETMREVEHPLTRAIIEIVARDESRHTRLGWLYLDWAAEQMDDAERARLATVATRELERIAPVWRSRTSRSNGVVTSEGYRLRDVHELGWLESQTYAALARKTVRDDIVGPLAKYGITLDEALVSRILA
jgi:hypothetical protein